MASVSVAYVVGWENNRKRTVWLFCFTSEANRPASVLAMLYYQCSDAGGVYAFLTLKNTEGEETQNAQSVSFPRRLSIRQPRIIEELTLLKKIFFHVATFLFDF